MAMGMVDSSVLVSLLAPEADGERSAERLDSLSRRIASPLVIFETAAALSRIRQAPPTAMGTVVMELVQRARIDLVPITADHALTAISAFERYGKGRGHPAQLNMGDCFSYAVARVAGIPLLFKGDDFTHTDMERA